VIFESGRGPLKEPDSSDTRGGRLVAVVHLRVRGALLRGGGEDWHRDQIGWSDRIMVCCRKPAPGKTGMRAPRRSAVSFCRRQARDKTLGGDKDAVPEQGPVPLVQGPVPLVLTAGWVGALASVVGCGMDRLAPPWAGE